MNRITRSQFFMVGIAILMVLSICVNVFMFNNLQDIRKNNQDISIENEELSKENDLLNMQVAHWELDTQELEQKLDNHYKSIESLQENEQVLNDYINDLQTKLEKKNLADEKSSTDPYSYIYLSEEDLLNFNTREKFILNNWNQLAVNKSELGFWDVKIGDDISTILEHGESGYSSYYRFPDDSYGEEGIEIHKDNMDIFFIGTRVKAMIIHYSLSDETRYKVDNIDELFTLVKEDYNEYNVKLEDGIVKVTDEMNDVEMEFIYFDDRLTIFVNHIG